MRLAGKTIQVKPATQGQIQECLESYHPSGFLTSCGLYSMRPFGLGEAYLTSFKPGHVPDFGESVPVARMDFSVLRGDDITDLFGMYSVWYGTDGKAMRVSYEGATPGTSHKDAPRLHDMRMSADVVEAFDGKAMSKNERGFFRYMFPGFGDDSISFFENVMSETGTG